MQQWYLLDLSSFIQVKKAGGSIQNVAHNTQRQSFCGQQMLKFTILVQLRIIHILYPVGIDDDADGRIVQVHVVRVERERRCKGEAIHFVVHLGDRAE